MRSGARMSSFRTWRGVRVRMRPRCSGLAASGFVARRSFKRKTPGSGVLHVGASPAPGTGKLGNAMQDSGPTMPRSLPFDMPRRAVGVFRACRDRPLPAIMRKCGPQPLRLRCRQLAIERRRRDHGNSAATSRDPGLRRGSRAASRTGRHAENLRTACPRCRTRLCCPHGMRGRTASIHHDARSGNRDHQQQRRRAARPGQPSQRVHHLPDAVTPQRLPRRLAGCGRTATDIFGTMTHCSNGALVIPLPPGTRTAPRTRAPRPPPGPPPSCPPPRRPGSGLPPGPPAPALPPGRASRTAS